MSNVSSSNSQGVHVPKLRFPGFEGEWSVHLLSEYLSESKIPGSDGKQAKKLSVKLWAKGVVEKNTVFEGSENTQYYIRKAGQLMYGKLDFLNCAFGIVPPELDGYESTLDAPAFDISNINSTFLLSRIIQRDFYKKNGDIANGSRKAKRIHPDTFLSMEITSPTLQEQEKIAEFIICLDKRIEKQRKLVEHLKSYKRGVSTALFTRKLRLSEPRSSYAAEWSKKYLGNIFSERAEKATGNERLLAVTINSGVQDRTDLDLKDNSSDDKRNYRVVRVGDLAYNTMRMWQGACGVSEFDGIVSPAYTVLYVADSSENFAPFWGYYFKEISMLHTFQRNSQGLTSDTWNLKYEKFAHISVYAPSFQEQVQIAEFLDHISDKITTNENLLNALVKYKRGLLSLLFI